MNDIIVKSEVLASACYITRGVLDVVCNGGLSIIYPEVCFLDALYDQYYDKSGRWFYSPEIVPVEDFSWTGKESRNSFDTLIDRILPLFYGTATIKYTWADGEVNIVKLDNHRVLLLKGAPG